MRQTTTWAVAVSVLVTLAGTAVLAAPGSGAPLAVKPAQPEAPTESFIHPLEYLLLDDWQAVAPNVMRRELDDGRIQTWATGLRGLSWMVNRLAEELATMERDYRVAPSEQLWKAIRAHEDLLEEARSRYGEAFADGPNSLRPMLIEPDPGCDVSWGYHAYANPGASASADAYFYNNCGYSAKTYAYAYVRTTENGVTNTASQSDPSGPGANVNSYAAKSLPADWTTDSCYSYARAYVDSPFGFFEETDSDSSCPPPPPPSVYITGTTYVWVPFGCKTYTWTANASGGTGGYSYSWTYNGSSVGSNSSTYSRTYCATKYFSYRTDTVGVTVTDSSGGTDSDTHRVTVELGDDCIQPLSGEIGEKALPEPCPEYPE